MENYENINVEIQKGFETIGNTPFVMCEEHLTASEIYKTIFLPSFGYQIQNPEYTKCKERL